MIAVAAAILTPIVLLYQSRTYYVFRKRLGGQQAETPVAALVEVKRSPVSSSQ